MSKSVLVKITDGPATPEVKLIPKHKKNAKVGEKKTVYSSLVIIEQEDAESFDYEANEEVTLWYLIVIQCAHIQLQITLMDWGNAIVRSKEVDASGTIVSITMNLNLDGDFQKTKKKITWLAQPTSEHPLASVALVDFDYLITKKKLQDEDEVADFVTPVSEFKELAYADANVLELHRGDIIQFERKGYYIYDNEVHGTREFFKIPDGKAAGIASKASLPTSSTTAPIAPSVPAASPSSTSMYKMDKIYQDAEINLDGTRMYKVENIYKS